MKKLIFFVASLLMLIALKTNAQNQRILLLESFTNTGCGPCATYNPGMDALIANNPDKVVAIKYHVNWPSSTDPMYQHNPTESSSRVNYYSVNSVPHVVVDGIRFSGNSGNITQSIIDQCSAIESPMQLRLSYEVNEAQNLITVNVMGRASTAIEGNLRLYVGVIEKEIHFNSAPGSNGERDFYDVMKKLLPNQQGMSLGQLAAEDYFAYSLSWELANIYDMSQLSAIAWVQNNNTKEVIQSCGASESIEPFFANEAGVANIFNAKSISCSGMMEPKVMLSNFGSNALTSAELDVLINDELLKTVVWTGNLAAFTAEAVDLGEVNFLVEEENKERGSYSIGIKYGETDVIHFGYGKYDEGLVIDVPPLNNEMTYSQFNIKGQQIEEYHRLDLNDYDYVWMDDKEMICFTFFSTLDHETNIKIISNIINKR